MTERLYYLEPYLASFKGMVVSCEIVDRHAHVVLDRTAFYPTSGGQPFDTGLLGGLKVIEVIDREDGAIVHVVESALVAGVEVEGRVDWTRRFDHMQQHTGQHVLSAAFDKVCGARTESFHLGTSAATIDLGREVSAAQIAAAEDEANRVVWEDRPVTIRFATTDEAAKLPLRKEPARTGPLRLIGVEDFDLSACGGTHVSRTGAIGIIAITGSEKVRGGTRIEFLGGNRVLNRVRVWREAFASTMKHLSVAPEELAPAIERLQADVKTQQRLSRSLQEQLASHEARALISRGQRDGDRLIVVEAPEGWDAPGLKALAVAATSAAPDAVVALFTRTTPALVVVARGAAGGIDAGAVLQGLTSQFGGKGGGKPDLAQGGGLDAPVDTLLQAARALLLGR